MMNGKITCNRFLIFSLVLCLSVLMVLATGCVRRTSGVQGSASSSVSPSGQVAYSNYVIINNQELSRGIQIVDLKSRYVYDMLQANVIIVNKYNKTLNIQYKFSWFDEAGMEIDVDSSAWTPVILYGNETKTLQGTAPNPSAVEFKINIRNQ
ncbi:YcfL family protein [bacterium]|nr:YcfL family protein [candidate division CSSED10-310 bacterium]